jgi:hypothetical protein
MLINNIIRETILLQSLLVLQFVIRKIVYFFFRKFTTRNIKMPMFVKNLTLKGKLHPIFVFDRQQKILITYYIILISITLVAFFSHNFLNIIF